MDKDEDDEVAEPDEDEVEEDAKEMYDVPETGRANIFVSGGRKGVLGWVIMGDCVSSAGVVVGVSSIR